MMTYASRFADELRVLRGTRRVETVARATRSSAETVHRYERPGGHLPRPDRLKALLEYYGVHAAQDRLRWFELLADAHKERAAE